MERLNQQPVHPTSFDRICVVSTSPNCSVATLELYLTRQLKDDAQDRVERHLDSCRECRLAIERLAASSEFWQQAQSALAQTMLRAIEGADGENAQGQTSDTLQHQQQLITRILEPPTSSESLGRFAGYDIVSVLGIGATGIVFKAMDAHLGRHVALKVLLPTLPLDYSPRERFQREARAAAAIDHPNVVSIFSVAEWNSLPFLVMQFVDGESLQQRLRREHRLSVDETIRVGEQIAAGLAAAHEKRLIHRDIKPSNLLIERDSGRVLITDFGLAQRDDAPNLTRTGVIAGTPQFMSPEQARGESLDARTDLFSLGSVLYTCLAGTPPFEGANSFAVLKNITDGSRRDLRAQELDVPVWLAGLIDQLHRPDRDERVQSSKDVTDSLRSRSFDATGMSSTKPVTRSGGQHSLRRILTARSVIVTAAVATLFGMGLVASLRSDKLHSSIPQRASLDHPRYWFPLNEPVHYLVTMSTSTAESDMTLDGVVTFTAKHFRDDEYTLQVACDLEVAESQSSPTEFIGEINFSGESRRWHHWQGTNEGIVRVRVDGTVMSSDGFPDFPLPIRSLPEMLFHPIRPNSTPELSVASVAESWIDAGDARMLLNESTGLMDRVQVDRTVIAATENVRLKHPVKVEFLRLDANEFVNWRNSRDSAREHKVPSGKPRLTESEERQLLDDLSNHKREMFWLHELSQRPVESFSSDVIDAIVVLSESEKSSIKLLADRLLKQVPKEKQNPFRYE